MLEAGFVLLYDLALSSFYTWTVGILSIRLLPGKFFLWCGGIHGHLLLWFCHFFLSLSFVYIFLFAKRKGLFLYLLTVTAGCADTLFQRLSSEDLPTGPWPLREIWE